MDSLRGNPVTDHLSVPTTTGTFGSWYLDECTSWWDTLDVRTLRLGTLDYVLYSGGFGTPVPKDFETPRVGDGIIPVSRPVSHFLIRLQNSKLQ